MVPPLILTHIQLLLLVDRQPHFRGAGEQGSDAAVELLPLHREQEREVLTAQAKHTKEELSRCVCKHSLTLCSAGSLHTLTDNVQSRVLAHKAGLVPPGAHGH